MRPRGRNERASKNDAQRPRPGAGLSSASNLANARVMEFGLGANGLRLVVGTGVDAIESEEQGSPGPNAGVVA